MIRNILSAVALTVVCGVAASAQPPKDPSQIKGCARTMTNDMRNCGGQQPQARDKAKAAGEAAQGRAEEETSCNQWALYSYYSCIYGGYGATKPVSVVPKPVPAATTVKTVPSPKAATPKIKN